jgi:hypothetical protein
MANMLSDVPQTIQLWPLAGGKLQRTKKAPKSRRPKEMPRAADTLTVQNTKEA